MAGLAACRRPVERVLPASRGIEDFVPGQAHYYTTVFQYAGEAMGLIVETHDGRPTKVEGNPAHPYSLGPCSVHGQASLLSLYDPDRFQKVFKEGNESSWDDFNGFVQSGFVSKIGKGEGLRFLSGRILSPSYRAVKASVLKAYPQAKWVEYDPFAPENVLEGTNIAFGQPLTPHYVFDKASVVLSLDSDFLGSDSGTVRPAKLWTKNRHLYEGETELNRLYAVESRHSLTGMNADHRRRLRSTEIPGFAVDLEAALEGQSPAGSAATFIWWAGAISYPIVVGGKPLFAFTFSIPIMFELMILFSAFGSLFGMLGINGLPQFYHSIFNYTESDRISDDGFVLAIESGDPQFDALECVSVLEAAGATSAEVVAK